MIFKKDFLKSGLAIGILLVAFSSCNKKEKVPEFVSPIGEAAEQASQGKADVFHAEGYVIRFEGALYNLISEENEATKEKKLTTKWKVTLDWGEKLAVNLDPVRATLPNEKTESVFFKARRDNGIEGYILEQQVAMGGALAVVVDKPNAVIYTSQKALGASTYNLPYGTVLVYKPESERDGFYEISAHDFSKKVYYPLYYKEKYPQMYMKASSLSMKNEDIQSAVILQTAKNVKTQAQKMALLQSALNEYANTVFSQEIYGLMNPFDEIEEFDAFYPWTIASDNGDAINIRDKPGVYGTVVVGSLKDGYACYFNARTKDKDTIEGKTAQWYRTSRGMGEVNGWIFGGYINFQRNYDQ